MGDQQVQISETIVQLGKVYEENKANMEKTNAFKPFEIISMVEPIQIRSTERQASYDTFNDFINRSKNIYN
jgi:hypothetical protein